MKVLFVGDSQTWILSENPSSEVHKLAYRMRKPSMFPIGTVDFYSSIYEGHTVDFLWKTGMNANDAKFDTLKKLFDDYKLCPCTYDFVVFGLGDMDMQFKYRVRTMALAAETYFNGVVKLMDGYLDRLMFRDPTTRLTSSSQNYIDFMSKLTELCVSNNIPSPIMTMDTVFGGEFEPFDNIGHTNDEDTKKLKKYLIDYLTAIYN